MMFHPFFPVLLLCCLGGSSSIQLNSSENTTVANSIQLNSSENTTTLNNSQNMAAMEQRLLAMQTILQDVLANEKAQLADLNGLQELRREVQALKSEVRLTDSSGTTRDNSNEAVLQDWVKESVVELRQEVREVERRLEGEEEADRRLLQVQDREAGDERRLAALEAVVTTAQVN